MSKKLFGLPEVERERWDEAAYPREHAAGRVVGPFQSSAAHLLFMS